MVLTAGALAATLIPAWRASNVSPTDALRLE
jgi:ABC-type lipoprotein release transport system permease subunit